MKKIVLPIDDRFVVKKIMENLYKKLYNKKELHLKDLYDVCWDYIYIDERDIIDDDVTTYEVNNFGWRDIDDWEYIFDTDGMWKLVLPEPIDLGKEDNYEIRENNKTSK